ncbi:hypothetical protein [Rhodococcus jostii]|uniref:Uncharacterized protein n=1 Tax=Rhodococcus jostii TaxID=132919 RepID=A0A1H5F6T4_RHOJO|nr:hypothetical protein [Rhodococcus jostii]SED98848.1 hypothetical protein SAMN04490220_6276 [Rhodococcus jostii]
MACMLGGIDYWDRTISLSSELQALTEEAATELTRFDVEIGHITAPFASILLRTESASRSAIENLTSGARHIALAELGEHASRNARLIVGNVRAMQAAWNCPTPSTSRAILRTHRSVRSPTAAPSCRTWNLFAPTGAAV